MKLASLINENFQKALLKLTEQPLPAKTAFKLKGITKKVKEEVNSYEDLRKEALNRFGRKKENGELDLADNGHVLFEQEAMQEFIKYLQELMTQEIEITSISIKDLGDISLTADDLLNLDELIVE